MWCKKFRLKSKDVHCIWHFCNITQIDWLIDILYAVCEHNLLQQFMHVYKINYTHKVWYLLCRCPLTFLMWSKEIHFIFWTNIFHNLNQYILLRGTFSVVVPSLFTFQLWGWVKRDILHRERKRVSSWTSITIFSSFEEKNKDLFAGCIYQEKWRKYQFNSRFPTT